MDGFNRSRYQCFGAFQLDCRARELRRHGVKVRVPDQSIQVLSMLLNAEYITWQGHRFEGSGVKPDFEVPWSPEASAVGRDNQLESALQVVSGI